MSGQIFHIEDTRSYGDDSAAGTSGRTNIVRCVPDEADFCIGAESSACLGYGGPKDVVPHFPFVAEPAKGKVVL